MQRQKNDKDWRFKKCSQTDRIFDGLKKDVITHVDDVALSALTLQQGVDRLRGETGSVVGIQYLRGNVATCPWSVVGFGFKCTLDTEDNVGVITIRGFSEQTMRFLNQALEEFKIMTSRVLSWIPQQWWWIDVAIL